MKITAEKLIAAGACGDQLKLFINEWPGGAEITLKNCIRAAELGLNLDWFVGRFATAPAREEHEKARATAREEHEKAMAPARAEHEKAMAPAREEHEKAMAPAWAEHKKATATARAEYEKAMTPAWANYKKATATAWAEHEKARATACFRAIKDINHKLFGKGVV